MTFVEYVEKVLGIKMCEYQKKILAFLSEHPDAKIIYKKGKVR